MPTFLFDGPERERQVPPGRYRATFQGLKETTGPWGPCYRVLTETERGTVSQIVHNDEVANRGSVWHRIASALVGHRLIPGERFDPADYIDAELFIDVEPGNHGLNKIIGAQPVQGTPIDWSPQSDARRAQAYRERKVVTKP